MRNGAVFYTEVAAEVAAEAGADADSDRDAALGKRTRCSDSAAPSDSLELNFEFTVYKRVVTRDCVWLVFTFSRYYRLSNRCQLQGKNAIRALSSRYARVPALLAVI
jgi:hypothetical protein